MYVYSTVETGENCVVRHTKFIWWMLISTRWVVWKFCCMRALSCSFSLSYIHHTFLLEYVSVCGVVWRVCVCVFLVVYICCLSVCICCFFYLSGNYKNRNMFVGLMQNGGECDNRSSNKSVRWTSCVLCERARAVDDLDHFKKCLNLQPLHHRFSNSFSLSLSSSRFPYVSWWHVDLNCFSSILLPIWSIRLLYSYNIQQRKPWCSWSSAVWMRKAHSFRSNQINDGWICCCCCCCWLFHFCSEALFAFY